MCCTSSQISHWSMMGFNRSCFAVKRGQWKEKWKRRKAAYLDWLSSTWPDTNTIINVRYYTSVSFLPLRVQRKYTERLQWHAPNPEHMLDKLCHSVSAPLDLSLLHWFGWFGWCTLLSQEKSDRHKKKSSKGSGLLLRHSCRLWSSSG